jgi:hypothetical protein
MSRRAEKRVKGVWLPVAFTSLTSGCTFRLFEDDGTPVVNTKTGETTFIAASKPYVSESGVETIKVYDPAPRRKEKPSRKLQDLIKENAGNPAALFPADEEAAAIVGYDVGTDTDSTSKALSEEELRDKYGADYQRALAEDL